MSYTDSTHGGSPVWSSAIGAAMGDGIVPRTGTIATDRRHPRGVRWPWARKARGGAAAETS